MEWIKIPSPEAQEYAKKLLVNLKKGIIKYLSSFKEEINKSYFDYISSVTLAPDASVKASLLVPGAKKEMEQVDIDFNCPIQAEIKFSGIVVEKVIVRVEFPKTLIGPSFKLPQIVVSSPTYKPYLGYLGLAWEGLTGVKNKIGFYPYEDPAKMKEDIAKFSKENIVDPLCDFLNNYKTKSTMILKSSIAKFLSDKDSRQYWSYPSPLDKNATNTIGVPINIEFNKATKQSDMIYRFYTVTDSWVPLSNIVLNVFCPLSESTAYFNKDGELMSEDEIVEELTKIEGEKSKKSAQPKVSVKEKIEREENWDPFKAEKAIKRDEFGFMMDKRNAEFGTKDVESARQKVAESQQGVFRQQQIDAATQKGPEPQDVSKWSSESAWYNEMQGKTFTLQGGTQNLSLVDRGEYGMINACKPPFVLRFARDQIRINQNMVGIEVQKILFKFYRLGFLQLKA